MNKPYDDEKWANRLKNAKNTPYLYKIQAFGSVINKRGKYLFEKRYVYSEYITQIQDWRKRDETTVITEIEGEKVASGLIAFQIEMRNYNPVTNPNPFEWYLITVKCTVPKIYKNTLLTKSYAFQIKGRTTIVNGGFHINEIDKGFSQKLLIQKPNFKGDGNEFSWLEKGKPQKTTEDEINKLFEEGKLMAIFATEDWARIGKTTKLN